MKIYLSLTFLKQIFIKLINFILIFINQFFILFLYILLKEAIITRNNNNKNYMYKRVK